MVHLQRLWEFIPHPVQSSRPLVCARFAKVCCHRKLVHLAKQQMKQSTNLTQLLSKQSGENSSDQDENSDSDEDEQLDKGHETTNTPTVLELIHQVNAWSRFEGPES